VDGPPFFNCSNYCGRNCGSSKSKGRFEYGNVTLAEWQAHATCYMAGFMVNGQNAVMLYNFLFDSLTIEGLNKVNVDTTPYQWRTR
jgi:hypothetical protein